MRAVVTGGAGFIGSHVVEALLARGDEVHVLDDLSKGKRERVAAGAELHVADIRDPDAVFDAVRPEAVFHLAAQADVRVSVERSGARRRRERARHACASSRPRAATARRSSSPRPAARSTASATARRPSRAERRPLAPYGTSKLCGEEYLATWNRLYGTRPRRRCGFANVYGPRQEPHGEAGVVAIFMGLLHDGGTPKIYGDGSQTRDYVFVGDVVARDARGARAASGGVFNVGTGVETSVRRAVRRDPARERRHARARVRRGAARRAAAQRPRHLARRARARLAPRALARRRARADVGLDRWRSSAPQMRIGSGRATRRADPDELSRGAPRRSSSARSRRSSSSALIGIGAVHLAPKPRRRAAARREAAAHARPAVHAANGRAAALAPAARARAACACSS